MVPSETETLSRDQAFDILSNRRRRFALHYLSRHPEGVTLQVLARQIAAWENEIPVESLSKKQQKRVYVSLYQTHVPKLESLGVIEYDEDTGTIRLTNQADDVTPYLRTEPGRRRRWDRYYAALVLISALVFSATLLDLDGLAAVSPSVVGLAIIVAFAALTAVYFFQEYRLSTVSFDDLRELR